MTTINRSAIVPFSTQQLYEVVNDVACYPEFLPWCGSTQIHFQSNTEMKATVVAKKAGIEKSFTTHNKLKPFESIYMAFSNGPFEYLKGEWQFKALAEQGCQASLQLDFKFKRGLMTFAFKKFFEPAADKMMQAFIDRAYVIYGK